jgi:hypothetical protein
VRQPASTVKAAESDERGSGPRTELHRAYQSRWGRPGRRSQVNESHPPEALSWSAARLRVVRTADSELCERRGRRPAEENQIPVTLSGRILRIGHWQACQDGSPAAARLVKTDQVRLVCPGRKVREPVPGPAGQIKSGPGLASSPAPPGLPVRNSGSVTSRDSERAGYHSSLSSTRTMPGCRLSHES